MATVQVKNERMFVLTLSEAEAAYGVAALATGWPTAPEIGGDDPVFSELSEAGIDLDSSLWTTD